ncbi:MAG: hypothetical protein Q4G28_09040 [Neisseria sp.]|nr:hypothetical protein [Neisseria sp.]
MRFTYLERNLRQVWLLWMVLVAVMFVGRGFLYGYFVAADVRQQYAGDLAALLKTGLLFDIKIASICAAVVLLPGLLSLLWGKAAMVYARIQKPLAVLLVALVLLATVANVFYFKVYERQFDVFVFGLAEEDTQAVLKTIWSDYPVLLISGGVNSFWLFD